MKHRDVAVVMPGRSLAPQTGSLALPQPALVVLWGAIVAVLTAFIVYRFDAITRGSSTPTDMVILLVWIAVLIGPLFQEVSIFGVRIKREIDALRDEIREQVWSIRNEIRNSVAVRSEVNPTFNIGLSEADRELLADIVAREIDSRLRSAEVRPLERLGAPDDALFLFSVRYNLDLELGRLKFLLSIPGAEYAPPSRIVDALAGRGLLDQAATASLREVYRICNSAIHGAKVSQADVAFVNKIAPRLIALLRSIETWSP